jgi:hypothetical protein
VRDASLGYFCIYSTPSSHVDYDARIARLQGSESSTMSWMLLLTRGGRTDLIITMQRV